MEEEADLELLEINQDEVRRDQVRRLAEMKSNRDEHQVQSALHDLEVAAREPKGLTNLLSLTIVAAKERATLGEISLALENAWGRYQPASQKVSGIFAAEMSGERDYQDLLAKTEQFASKVGRQPRILVAKMGQDGHDRGAKVVASSFADAGFDVDLGPLFSTPDEVARQAIENDVHVVGISSLAAGHKALVPDLIQALAKMGRPDILVVVGGVIPPNDHSALYESGVVGIFGPGTPISSSAGDVMDLLLEAHL